MLKFGNSDLGTARIIDEDLVLSLSTEEKEKNKRHRDQISEKFRKLFLGFKIYTPSIRL